MREYFPNLLGNVGVKSRIGRAIEEGRAPHAFLIGGPSGSGKSVLATEIAAAINCERRLDSGASLPCGGCNSCRRIYEGNFTDVKILEKRKDKATLGVDPIKDFRADMFLSATESRYKVYIIDDAESMTTEAQNALLKVLEEPPEGVFILLLAKECDRILTTIKSRTQYIAMTRFSEVEIEGFLLERSEEARRLARENKEKFKGAIMSSDGRLGLALALVDPKASEENEQKRRETLALIDAVTRRSGFGELYSAVNTLPQKRVELTEALESVISLLRDLILVKESKECAVIFFTSREVAEEYSARLDEKRLFLLYDAFSEALEYCQKNANVSNLLMNLLARINESVS